MSSWRDVVLREFTPQVSRLTLVADPDGLLLEEGVLEGIRDRGFDLIPFDDHVAFRFAYESKYRARWDRRETTDLVVVLRAPDADMEALPFDLLRAGRRLAFSLGALFPNLSYPVVAALDRSDLDALYSAQAQHEPGHVGDNATKDFILRHVFGVAPELVKESPDLLRILLRRHYRSERVPGVLDDRLVSVIRQNSRFADWPLEDIVRKRESFLLFLQERWPNFLERLLRRDDRAREPGEVYALKLSGPEDLPFEHDDVRVYVDNLFTEGMLDPVSHPEAARFAGQWAAVGVRIDPATDRRRRIEKLLQTTEVAIPVLEARHQDWLAFAYRWAQLVVLSHEEPGPDAPTLESIGGLRQQLDDRLRAWAQHRYAGLHNQPPVPPVMLHHVPRLMARLREDGTSERLALVIVDGLALDQWILLREALTSQMPGLRMQEDAVFAWVPAITSVSRQAAFAGRAPLYFPGSIYGTDKEPALWRQFWGDHGLSPSQVGYQKGLGDPASLAVVEEATSDAQVQALGLVVDKVDRIMHGMELGTAGMHGQVRQWAGSGFMRDLLSLLQARGFKVFLTSDHGNVEAHGAGRPAEGVIADIRGERVRVFPDVSLRARVKAGFPDAIEWPPIGLPENYLPLLAARRSAFTAQGTTLVGHGGICLEELIVPFVTFGGAA